MREIKFEAWDIGKKVFIPQDAWAVVTTDFGAFGVMLKDWENYREGEYFYSNAQVLREYTGLKDKNGKEIYEGDLVWIRATALDPVGQEKPHKIVFGNHCIGKDDWGLEHTTPCFCIEFCDDSGYCRIEADETIVIGNIYENSELIK